MGIWLKEAMKIEPFTRAELIAGKDGLDRMVVTANIQEVPNVDRWLSGGEILFTSGYAFGSSEDACRLLRRLNEKGVAALVIKPGQYLEEIPESLIMQANQLHFPLFRIPDELPYMDCILPIVTSITSEHQFSVERTERIHNQLMEELLKNNGLDGICSILSHTIGKPVFIFSNQGMTLTMEGGDLTDSSYEQMVSFRFHDFLSRNRHRRLLPNKCNAVEFEDFGKRLLIPVYAQNDYLAYLFLDCVPEDVKNTDLLAFESASTMIAIELLQERSLLEKEQNIYAQLLEDIFSKKYNDISIINQRLAYVGFDNSAGCVACVIGADNFEDFIKLHKDLMPEEEVQNVKTHFMDIISAALRGYSRRVLCMEDGVEMAALFSIAGEEEFLYARRLIGEILLRLKEQFPNMHFSAGFGRVREGVEEAGESWREAKLAKKAGKSLNHQNLKTITLFEDLGCMRFLYESVHSEEMRRFYDEYMHDLLENDKKNGMDLVHTLEVYFENNRNIRRTAEVLFVHKNSVIYRLKKIEDILGEKLGDHETAFNLQMCLKIKDLL